MNAALEMEARFLQLLYLVLRRRVKQYFSTQFNSAVPSNMTLIRTSYLRPETMILYFFADICVRVWLGPHESIWH